MEIWLRNFVTRVEKQPEKACAVKVNVPLVGDAWWDWERRNAEHICMCALSAIQDGGNLVMADSKWGKKKLLNWLFFPLEPTFQFPVRYTWLGAMLDCLCRINRDSVKLSPR